MRVEAKPPKCSQCGSTNSEHFASRTKSGIRCRSCGHESVHAVMPTSPPGGSSYTLTADDSPTF